jgi:ankyrin repeat protein
MVELLIRSQARVQAQGNQGTAIEWAIRNGHAKIVLALINGGASTIEISFDELDLMGAKNSHAETLEVLITALIRTNPEQIPELLEAAAQHGKKHLLISLLKAGANPDQSVSSHTPLAYAAIRGHVDLVQLLREAGANEVMALSSVITSGNIHAAELLIKLGITLDQELFDNTTLLFYAAMTGNEEMMQTLLASKMRPNATNAIGKTALMYAAGNGQLITAQMLIAANADLTATDAIGKTALMYAAGNGQLITAQMLIAANADLNATDADGKTALSHAALRGHVEMVGQLLTGAHAPSYDHLVATHVRIREAKVRIKKTEHPGVQALAAKYKQIISLLGNAISDAAPPVAPREPKPGNKPQWASFLPTKKSPSFEPLAIAKTIEDACEAIQEINQALIACDRAFSPSESVEFAQAMKSPIIQNNRHHLKLCDLLAHNVTIQQSFLPNLS